MLWQATAVDGTEFHSLSCETYERVNERGGAAEIHVKGCFGGDVVLEYHASCVSERGESLHLFTRRAIVGFASEHPKQIDMPVIELRRAGEMVSRLYLHPQHGPIFSSQDLNI